VKLTSILVALLAIGASPLAAQNDIAGKFGVRESVRDISMSPDGKSVAYLQPLKGRETGLFVAALDTNLPPKLVISSDSAPWQLLWCGWASNTRLVCKLYAVKNDAGLLLSFSRLVAINADSTGIKQLGQRATSRSLGINQYDGDIVGWPANDNGEVLMSRNYVPEDSIGTRLASTSQGLGVDRIDTLTLKTTREETPREGAVDYIADTAGNVRIMASEDAFDDGTLRGTTRYSYRSPGDRTWKSFSSNSEASPGLVPVAVDSAENVAYAFGKKDGRQAIFKVSLDGEMKSEVILSNDTVDVHNILTLGRSGRVIGAQFVTDKRETVIFDTGYRQLASRLSKALPGFPLVQIVGASRDENRLLIFAGNDTDPGRYYVYDKLAKRLNEIMLARPQLEGIALAPVKPVSYAAADGTIVPAYLTLPPSGGTKGLPALVIPHGGPSSRDEWGFDWLAQHFAAAGFAVLQPNFRGSAGYGDNWYLKNGFKSWRTSIGDVNDAGRWLIAQGIADSNKLGILGWSYGGYAALQSGVLDPSLYKAIVAIAPVTDLRMLIEQSRGFVNSKLVKDFVGSGEHIISGSPLRQAALLKAPVLMFSGDLDLNVDVEQAKAMNKELLEKGQASELVIYPGLDHQIDDSVARIDMLQKSTNFLRSKLRVN
jgi:dipeptidyl aminopeptidase/acylaminoacyl peptidase